MKYRLLLILTAMIWGFAFVAQSVAMNDIGPLTFNAARSLLGAVSLLPVLLLSRREAPPVKAAFPRWLGILFAGLIFSAGTILQQCGILYTTASKASFITATYILMVPFFGLFLGNVLRVNHVIGAVLAMAGVYFLSVTEALTVGTGDLLVFLCAFCFSAHILYLDYASVRYDPVEIAAGQFLVCAVINLAGALLFETIRPEALLAAWQPILYTGLLSTGAAYTLQIIGQKHLPPTECSMLLSLEMVFGGLGGVFLLGETMTSREFVGVLCMTAGVFWSQLPSRALLSFSSFCSRRRSHTF